MTERLFLFISFLLLAFPTHVAQGKHFRGGVESNSTSVVHPPQTERELVDLLKILTDGILDILTPTLNTALRATLKENFDPIELGIDSTEQLASLPFIPGICEIDVGVRYLLGVLTGMASIQIDTIDLEAGQDIFRGGPFEKKRFNAIFKLSTYTINPRTLEVNLGLGMNALLCGFTLDQFLSGMVAINGVKFNTRVRLKGDMGWVGADAKVKEAYLVGTPGMGYNGLSVDIPDIQTVNSDAQAQNDEFARTILSPASDTAIEETSPPSTPPSTDESADGITQGQLDDLMIGLGGISTRSASQPPPQAQNVTKNATSVSSFIGPNQAFMDVLTAEISAQILNGVANSIVPAFQKAIEDSFESIIPLNLF